MFHFFTRASLSQEKRFKDLLNTLANQLKITSAQKTVNFSTLQEWEQNTIHAIRSKTTKANRNNVTRTSAYYHFYCQYPELHWALLAHMVSRNSGWNMTDLKGEWLPRIMEGSETADFFQFLERSNWLIFHDAYPQLLLYSEGKRIGINLSYLLPYFFVSRFMKPIWDYFWYYKDSRIITVAMIINEQNYIQKRVVENPLFVNSVFKTMEYKAQSLFNMNHIIFPSYSNRHRFFTFKNFPGCKLKGLHMKNFSSLENRIETGKKLYQILYPQGQVDTGILKWAQQYPHTGSRADYWFHLFHPVKTTSFHDTYQKKIKRCRLKNKETPVYSPYLKDVWPDKVHAMPNKEDWFINTKMLPFLQSSKSGIGKSGINKNFTKDYCFYLNKMELGVITEEKLL